MGKYDFTSPGAAAGSGIMEVMTQRRAEARQRMLDEIAAKDSESERNLRDIQGQTAKTQSEIAQFEEARKNWHAGQQVTGPMADIAAKYNALGKDPNQPTPQVSTEESFSVPDDPSAQVEQPVGPNQPVTLPKADTGSNFYQGSQEDQTRERRRANMDRVKQAIAAHPDMSEMEKMLTVSQALEDPNLPGEFWKTLEDPQAVNSFDPVSNKVTPLMGKDGKPITTRGNQTIIDRGRPPVVPRDSGQVVGPAKDAEGKDIPGKVVVMLNGRLQVTDLPTGVSGFGAKPTAAGSKNTKFSPAEANRLSKLRKDATDGPWLSAKDSDVAAYNQQLNTSISNYPTTQDVKDTVRDILRKEPANVPTADIVANYKDDFSPEELDALQDLLAVARDN